MNLQTLSHISLTTDVIIFGGFILALLVGAMVGLEKVKLWALSVYVGLVLATSLGNTAYDAALKHGLSFTPGRVKIILFTLSILALSLTPAKSKRRRGNMMMAIVLAVLVVALITSSVIFLMDGDQAAQLLGNSTLAMMIYKFRLVWLGVVPVVAVAASLMKGDKKH